MLKYARSSEGDHHPLPNAWAHRGLELEYPVRMVEPADWAEHVPFAFWIVENLKPDTLVELGLDSGNSYCAFLQAVQTLGLATRCFGVRHERSEVEGLAG